MVYPKKEFALYKGDELRYRKRTKDNKARRLVCLND